MTWYACWGAAALHPSMRDLAGPAPRREVRLSLYLSPCTVEKHVESLQRKTGIAGRARLAVYAAGGVIDRRPAR